MLDTQKMPSRMVSKCGLVQKVCSLELRIWFKSLPCYFLIFLTLSEPQISPLQNEDNNTNFVGLLQDLNKKYILRVSSTMPDTQKRHPKRMSSLLFLSANS